MVIGDCSGRLANRLTVFANLAAYSNRTNGLVIDVASNSELPLDTAPLGFIAEKCLILSESPIALTSLEILLLKILVKCRKGIKRLSFRCPVQIIAGVRLVRADGGNRVVLDNRMHAQFGSLQTVLTGIFYELDSPTDVEQSGARSMFFPGRPARQTIGSSHRPANPAAKKVGVHIRQGDYKSWQGGRFYHGTEDYARAMGKCLELFGGLVEFVIVSDTEQNQGDFDRFANARIVTRSELEDLLVLADCDYIIATHSSFANFASFYGMTPILAMRTLLSPCASDLSMAKPAKPVGFPKLTWDYHPDVC